MSVITDFTEYLRDNKNNDVTFIENCPLSGYSSFKIGGNAAIAVFSKSSAALISVTDKLNTLGIRYTVVGNATNILFDDGGYDGAVIFTTKMNRYCVCGNMISCDAGVSFTALSALALKNSLTGLEFAYGIPGTVGGAVYMNAGAYGGETAYVLEESTYYNPETREICVLTPAKHKFAYRQSFYMEQNYIIIKALFRLKSGEPEQIKLLMDDYMHRRQSRQPLEFPSAGSVFKRYPGFFTAKLIDEAGLKGATVGGARVSDKHAGFIINTGTATSDDVLKLIGLIKEKILETNGIHLETEIRYIV